MKGHKGSEDLLELINNNAKNLKHLRSGGGEDTFSTDINSYYSLNVNTLPPYVISRLSKNIGPSTQETDSGDSKFSSTNDPFIDSFTKANNWGDFLAAVKECNSDIPIKVETYADSIEDSNEVHSFDPLDKTSKRMKDKDALANEIFRNYQLNSTWKGNDRLKSLFEGPADDAICSDSDSDNDLDDDEDLEKGEGEGGIRKSMKNKFQYRNLKATRRNSINQREIDIREKAKMWYKNRKDLKPRLMQNIMTNSYVPLFFRLLSITLTIIAIILAGKLVRKTETYDITQQPSPLMALIVQSIAIIYLFYITYDEFTSQPLGLRNPTAKMRLVLFDLVFIIFSSANLSLSFQSIYDNRWVCTAGTYGPLEILTDPTMCHIVKALTAFLCVTLVVWCINFTISVSRIVHVVSNKFS